MSETLTKPPSKFRKAVDWITTASPTRRIVVVCIVGLLLLLAVLFTVDRCGNYLFARKQDKLKANVNAALSNIEQRNAVIANLKEQQAVETKDVENNAKEYLEAQQASDAAKAETDKAIENMKKAANANGNVSITEFKNALRGL